MGVFYKAEDNRLEPTLKFLSPLLVHDQEGRKHFEREVRAAAALSQRRIVQLDAPGGCIDWPPDGRRIAASTQAGLRDWDR